MNTLQTDGEAGNPPADEGKFQLPGIVWAFAVLVLVISEATIMFVQLHRFTHGPRSLSFWCTPVMPTAPLMDAAYIYRTIARKSSFDRAALKKWSFYLAWLACVANVTTLFCYVSSQRGFD